MNVKPQRPQPQYAPTMSGPASSAFTALSSGMNGNIGFQGLPQGAPQPGYPEIGNMASSLGLFFPPQGLGQQVTTQAVTRVPWQRTWANTPPVTNWGIGFEGRALLPGVRA